VSVFTMVDCTMKSNGARGALLFSGGFGGAVAANDESTIRATDCTMTSNYAELGGAVYMRGATGTVTRCEMTSNSANVGGAVYIRDGAFVEHSVQLTLDDSNLRLNRAEDEVHRSLPLNIEAIRPDLVRVCGSTPQGGALFMGGSAALISSCLLFQNTARVSETTASSPILRVINSLMLPRSLGGGYLLGLMAVTFVCRNHSSSQTTRRCNLLVVEVHRETI